MERNVDLYNAILKGDRNAARHIVQRAVERNADIVRLLDNSMIPPLHELGDLFSNKRVLLPDLLLGARAMQAGLDIIAPVLIKKGYRKRAKVCIGTVQGDRHDIGKNIVAMILKAAGYEVDDLGSDCSIDRYAQSVEAGSHAVLCSLMLTACIPNLKAILQYFAGNPSVKTVVGGAVMTRELAAELNANAYAADAAEVVRILDGFFGG
jgi:5-methyltetrahydrofolate--homocysteine methyltransferase